MGCDIHSFAETKNKETGKWERVGKVFTGDMNEKTDSPFDWRSYSMFAFLAGVRNYDHCEPVSGPRGFPLDSEYLNEEIKDVYGYSKESKMTRLNELKGDYDYHSASYLILKELMDFDYDKTFWNRRVSKPLYRADGSISGFNGASLAQYGEGSIVTYHENLGESFFNQIEEMKQLGNSEDVRVIFYFDN